MKEELDYSSITEEQAWLILYTGWIPGQTYPNGSPWPEPSQHTLAPFIKHKMIEKKGDGWTIPLWVHAEYCMWCDDEWNV